MFFEKNLHFIVILGSLIVSILSGCEMNPEYNQYTAACIKISSIYNSYMETGKLDENPKLEKNKYGNYKDLVLLEISYIKEGDIRYSRYNNSLNTLDSLDFYGDLKSLRPKLEKAIDSSKQALSEYKDTNSLIDTYVKKINALKINKSNKKEYIQRFKDNSKGNFGTFDVKYASISEKAIDKYTAILDVLDSFNKNKITKNAALSDIKTLRSDKDTIYKDCDAIFKNKK